MRVLRLASGALVVGLLVLLVWALLSSSRGAGFVRQIADGKRPAAPPFALTVIWPHSETWPTSAARLLADGRLSLRELRGRPVVVNFFASWCVACKQEAPLLHAEAHARAGKVFFLGIDVQDLTGDARDYIPGEATRATLDQGIASTTSAQKGGALPGGAHVTGP